MDIKNGKISQYYIAELHSDDTFYTGKSMLCITLQGWF